MRLTASIAALLLATTAAWSADQGPVTPMEVNPELAELGKRLFYDERLSGDTNLSCASCHQPDLAFTDGEALSTAYSGSEGFRNTPTLANVG